MKLIRPTLELEKEHIQMLQEWLNSQEELVPFVLHYNSANFPAYLDLLNGFEKAIDRDPSFVSHSTFWLTNNENRILGVINIRHRLTDQLMKEGGNIGYGIRPSERKKGYATKILELGLLECSKLGIKRVLITCDKSNQGSIKTILKNGGVFFVETRIGEKQILTFWIENNS